MVFISASITISIIAMIIGYICGKDDEKKALEGKLKRQLEEEKRELLEKMRPPVFYTEPVGIVKLQADRLVWHERVAFIPHETEAVKAELKRELLHAAEDCIHIDEHYDPERMEHHFRALLRVSK